MAGIVESFLLKLGFDDKAFGAGMQRVNSSLSKLDGIVKAVGLSMAVAFGNKKANEFVDFSDNLNKLSKATGESTDELQKWQNAVSLAGGDAENFNKSIKDISEELNLGGFAKGSQKLRTAFANIGINTHTAIGQFKKPLDLISELSDKFSTMSEPQALAYGKNFGLDDNTIRMLSKGRAELQKQLSEGGNVGIFSTQEIKRGAEMKRILNQMRTASVHLGLQIGSSLLPAFKLFNELMAKAGKWAKENERVIKASVVAVGTAISVALIPSVYALIKSCLAFMMTPIGMTITAIGAAVMLLVDDFMAFKEGADSFFNWDKIVEDSKPFISFLTETIPEAVKSVLGWFYWLGEQIGGVIASIVISWEKVTGAFGKVKSFFNFGNPEHEEEDADKREKKANENKSGFFGFGNPEKVQNLTSETMPRQVTQPQAAGNTVNNANRTTTIQNVNIKTEKVDADNIVPIAEKAAGMNLDPYQMNFALGG